MGSMINRDLERWAANSMSLCGRLEDAVAESFHCSRADAREFLQDDTLATPSEGECDADFVEEFFRSW